MLAKWKWAHMTQHLVYLIQWYYFGDNSSNIDGMKQFPHPSWYYSFVQNDNSEFWNDYNIQKVQFRTGNKILQINWRLLWFQWSRLWRLGGGSIFDDFWWLFLSKSLLYKFISFSGLMNTPSLHQPILGIKILTREKCVDFEKLSITELEEGLIKASKVRLNDFSISD